MSGIKGEIVYINVELTGIRQINIYAKRDHDLTRAERKEICVMVREYFQYDEEQCEEEQYEEKSYSPQIIELVEEKLREFNFELIEFKLHHFEI